MNQTQLNYVDEVVKDHLEVINETALDFAVSQQLSNSTLAKFPKRKYFKNTSEKTKPMEPLGKKNQPS